MLRTRIHTPPCCVISQFIPFLLTIPFRHAAASYGHLHVLEYLIEQGGDINVLDEDGDTPLYTVESIETAKFMFEHGATLDTRNAEGLSVCLAFATVPFPVPRPFLMFSSAYRALVCRLP